MLRLQGHSGAVPGWAQPRQVGRLGELSERIAAAFRFVPFPERNIMKIHLPLAFACLAVAVSACGQKENAAAKVEAAKVEAAKVANEAAQKADEAAKKAGAVAGAAAEATKEAGKEMVAKAADVTKEAADATKEAADKAKAAVGK